LYAGSEGRKIGTPRYQAISAGVSSRGAAKAALKRRRRSLTDPGAASDGTGSRLHDYLIASIASHRSDHLKRIAAMKTIVTLLAVAAFALAANAADAKGCLKGAVVGGVAGHYAGHHGVLGAIAGCAYGRHHAKEQARQQQDAPAAQQNQPPAGQEKL
jgi:hypothetical protein